MIKLAAIALGAVLIVSAPALAATSFSTDFESYTLGLIDGQDGWANDSTGAGVVDPAIVADPTGGGHGKVLKLDYTLTDMDFSGAYHASDDLISLGIRRFELSWAQWRPALDDNLWIAESATYDGWFGLEIDTIGKLDINGGFGLEPLGTLAPNQWQSIRIKFDADTATAEGFVDGVSFGTAAGVSLDQFRGIDFEFSGTDVGGGVHGPVYLDNISLQPTVPEPSSLVGLVPSAVTGLLIVRRRRTLD